MECEYQEIFQKLVNVTDSTQRLAERFHTFVCLRLTNRIHNIQYKSKAKDKDKTGTGSYSGLDYRSSSESPESPEDERFNSSVGESESSEPGNLSLGLTEPQVDDDPSTPSDDMNMRPNIAPTACMLSNQGSMGDTQSKIDKANAECARRGRAQHMEQHDATGTNHI